jgi:cell wall assembly regulator SMI1
MFLNGEHWGCTFITHFITKLETKIPTDMRASQLLHNGRTFSDQCHRTNVSATTKLTHHIVKKEGISTTRRLYTRRKLWDIPTL